MLDVQDIEKYFEGPDGTLITVLDGISFSIDAGAFTTIMGPSGCGKSTLLNILAGITKRDGGTIKLHDKTIQPGNLPFAYVFQEPRLLNWLTVRENIVFALKSKGVPSEEHDKRVEESLSMVGLREDADNYPLRLSGGMRQRVGLARALAVEPEVLLMDEPFSELDELTARRLRSDLLDLWQKTEKTILFVTHDITEAVFLSDEILFLDNQGHFFNHTRIEHPRPRDFEDPELLQTEARLMEEFFSHLETSSN